MKPEHFPSNPEHLWNIFYDITRVPRPSKHEEKATSFLINLAQEHGLKYHQDNVKNVIIYVPGKGSNKDAAPLIIQNHIDMVTDALHDRKIDFMQDPIETEVDGEWLKAIGTTLGADNGIGCAAALATIFEKDMDHPPLELLFTTDEETGLNGALGLEAEYLKARRMLNLDTEEWGSLYIGCAGGIDYELNKEVSLIGPKNSTSYRLLIEGFVGGHSGVNIHEQRGNAIKFMAELLDEMVEVGDFEITEIRAGKAHNIIPRDGFVDFWTNEENINKFEQRAQILMARWKNFLPDFDQSMQVSFTQQDVKSNVLTSEDQKELIQYMNIFPHGAHSYNLENRDLVSMSNNFARFLVVNGKVYTQSSLRFFDREEVKSLEKEVRNIGKTFGMKVECHSEYPSWKPSLNNPMLDLVKSTFIDLYKREPDVTAIHAGLECGILRDKIGPIDVISFGPTITGAHSPDERVHIPSVEKFWDLFKEVLARL